MNPIYLLLFGEIILFCFAYVLTNFDLLAPSVFMCIMFVISTLFAVLNVENWDYGLGYSLEATLLILGGLFTFTVSETMFRCLLKNSKISRIDALEQKKVAEEKIEIVNVNIMIVFLIFITDLLICYLYYNEIKRIVGFGGTEMFAEYRRMGISRMAGEERESINGIINQLTNFPVAAGYVSGYIFIKNFFAKDRFILRQFFLASIIALGIVPGLMTAGRTQILMYFAAFLIYYYIIWNQKYSWKKNLSLKFIEIGIASIFVGIPAFYYSLKLIGRVTRLPLFDYASDYLGSSILLFGKYVEDPIPCTIWGEESLYSVRKIIHALGLGPISTSYNLEFRSTGVANSNIYTFFRRPLHDFGIIGMLIFTALVAIFFAWMYWGKIKGNKKRRCVNYWSLTYGYFFYWIFCSSMDQYSQTFISIGAMVKITMILCGFWLASNYALRQKTMIRVIKKRIRFGGKIRWQKA